MQKKKSMEKQERRRTKDFFDRIAPSTIRFYADHYIVGDSYRCAWAIREYPPSTDEQAIFSRIADKSGVTLRIYHRLVEPMEQRKIIQNAMRKNKLKTGGTDMTETVEAEGNLQDVIELLANMRKMRECLLHCSVFVELKAKSMDALKELQSEVLMRCGMSKELYADNEAIPSGGYTNAEHIRFESAGECFVKLPDGEVFIEYVSGVEYYKPGKYTFYAQTESGTLTEHYTVVIDRTQKQLTIENVSDGMTDGDVTIMWTDGDVEQFAPVVSVTVNGKTYNKGTVISRNAPVIEIIKDESGKTLDIVIKASSDDESHIQTLEIYKSVNGETWELLTLDDYSTEISVKTLSYSFRTSGQYRVVVTDEFRTGIDSVTEQIEYSQPVPEGILFGVENDGYTNGEVTFVWTDEATVSLTKDGEKISYTSGQKLNENGEYVLTFRNFDGYETAYHFVIDSIAPEIKTEGLENGNTVNQDVKVLYEEQGVTAEIFKNGKLLGEYISGTTVGESGEYTIVVTDRAGNKTEVKFTIDKEVDFTINVNDKGLSNSVTVTAAEDVTLILTKGEEVVEYKLGDAITEVGDYTLTVTDALGNKAKLSFTIVESLVQKFEYNFDEAPGFEKVLVNGEEKRLNYGTLELLEDGTYEVEVVADGATYSFKVTVDMTAPTLKLEGVADKGTTKSGVTLSDLSEKATVEVYRNDEKVEYTFGEMLTEVGEYRVVVTDEAGNTTAYTFEIQEGYGWIVIAVVALVVVLLAGGVVLILLKKRNG